MYTRQAYKKEEVWLLDVLEEEGLDESAFRSREFTFVFDEESSQRPIAFGRVRENTIEERGLSKEPFEETEEDLEEEPDTWCEFSTVHLLPEGRKTNSLDTLLEAMVRHAQELGYTDSYLFTQSIEKYTDYGFETVNYESLPEYVEDRKEKHDMQIAQSSSVLKLQFSNFTVPDTEALSQEEIEKELEEQEMDEEHTYKYET